MNGVEHRAGVVVILFRLAEGLERAGLQLGGPERIGRCQVS